MSKGHGRRKSMVRQGFARRHLRLGWVDVEWGREGVLQVASKHVSPPPRRAPLFFGISLLLAVAVGAYPISRRIARGLEQLRAAVTQFGSGELSTRVSVRGSNEVADVAKAFNRSAERIENLVATQRRMLASASHELRSPLARLRAAVELLAEGRADLLPEAERNIAELDELVADLLLAARLELDQRPIQFEAVDLAQLIQEEASQIGASFEGEGPAIQGDRRLLGRLLRNLLENAKRYGQMPIRVVLMAQENEAVRIQVFDAGPGGARSGTPTNFRSLLSATGSL